jgi:hypothetical protein
VSDLLNLFVPNATWRDGPCAEVRVGDHVIRYVRRGTGSSIVVVGGDSDANPGWRQLIQNLAASHRVIVTQPPPVDADVSSWLRGFIEGVGLTSVTLIAGGTVAEAATDVASADDFTVRKLILLPVDGSTSIDESLRRIEAEIAADDAAA